MDDFRQAQMDYERRLECPYDVGGALFDWEAEMAELAEWQAESAEDAIWNQKGFAMNIRWDFAEMTDKELLECLYIAQEIRSKRYLKKLKDFGTIGKYQVGKQYY